MYVQCIISHATHTHTHLRYTIYIVIQNKYILSLTHMYILPLSHTHVYSPSLSYTGHILPTGSHNSSVGHEVSQRHSAKEGTGGAQGSCECCRLWWEVHCLSIWRQDHQGWSDCSLVPRHGGRGGERAPGTHCLCMHPKKPVATVLVHVHWWHQNLPHWCASWHFVWVKFILHCSMPSGSWVSQNNECIYQGNIIPFCGNSNFGKSFPTTAYQTFLFGFDSTQLSRIPSSNVYSILRTKTEVIFMRVYAVHVNHWSDRRISTRP